jgi:ABC-type Fe3+/spermidine/putrescine transport system ATPase subunit
LVFRSYALFPHMSVLDNRDCEKRLDMSEAVTGVAEGALLRRVARRQFSSRHLHGGPSLRRETTLLGRAQADGPAASRVRSPAAHVLDANPGGSAPAMPSAGTTTIAGGRRFYPPEAYHATLAHEMGHWSGELSSTDRRGRAPRRRPQGVATAMIALDRLE